MLYRGEYIEDNAEVMVEDHYKDMGSNDFELYKEDLEDLIKAFEEKQNELAKAGLDPEKLKMNFYANESYDGDYYQCDAECEISFHYYRPETQEEKEERIKKAKKRINEKIADEERKAEISRKDKERELQKAMEILKKNGFNVVSDK